MKHLCRATEEAIWDSVRESSSLPEEALRHLQHCQSCARTYQQVKPALHLLHEAGQVEEVPELATITLPSHPSRNTVIFQWAFGLCAVLLILFLLPLRKTGTTVARTPVPKKPSAAPSMRIARAPKLPDPIVQFKPEPSPVKLSRKPASIVHLEARPVRRSSARTKPRSGDRDNTPIRIAMSMKTPPQKPDIKISQVSVSWTPADNDQYSYSSRVENTQTGSMIHERVERTGDTVHIYMSSHADNEVLPTQDKERG